MRSLLMTRVPLQREERRVLGLVLLRGDEVIALTIEGPPPADALTAKIKAAAVRCCTAVSGSGCCLQLRLIVFLVRFKEAVRTAVEEFNFGSYTQLFKVFVPEGCTVRCSNCCYNTDLTEKSSSWGFIDQSIKFHTHEYIFILTLQWMPPWLNLQL